MLMSKIVLLFFCLVLCLTDFVTRTMLAPHKEITKFFLFYPSKCCLEMPIPKQPNLFLKSFRKTSHVSV